MVRTWWLRPHWFAELWSAIVLMTFSAWSTIEPSSLAQMKSFHEAVQIMPAGAWDCATGAVGLLQFGALWLDWRWLRGMAAALATWLISALALGAVLQFPSPLDAFPLGFLGVNLFALMRAIGNAR